MKRQHPTLTIQLLGIMMMGLSIVTATVNAQNGRPDPLPANGPGTIQDDDNGPPLSKDTGSSRRLGDSRKLMVNLNDVSVEQTLKLIVEATGKVVIPIDLNTTLKTKKITLMVDKPIDQSKALDLLFQAFRLNEIGVIEKDDRIIIALLSEILQFDPPVVGADVDIMNDTNLGTIITKVYRLKYADVEAASESLEETMPDWATMTVNASSNQIIVQGDVGLCQRIQRIIDELDRVFKEPKTQTFSLRFADANEVAQQILDLFEETNTSSGRNSRNQSNQRRQTNQGGRRNQSLQRPSRSGGTESVGGQPLELRVSVNVQQNSVTVSGEPTVVDEVATLISTYWDLRRPEGTAKKYVLQYTDPVKIQEMLQELLGGGGGTLGGGGGGRGPGATGTPSQVGDLVSGIYQMQAYPDSSTLLVICKTEDNFLFLDNIIAELDQPVIPKLPLVVALKHADAEEVADEVNVLLAPAGTRADIQRKDTGLIGFNIAGPTADGGGADTAGREGEAGGNITFPWQQTRQTEDETPPSPLIGKVRVVPVHRQNSVMILAPLEYRDAVRDFIVDVLDSPGRQVMVSAVIAEIELKDEFALGFRFSNSDSILSGTLVDNRIGGTFGITGQEDPLFNNDFLDTSVLDVNVSLNAVIQALDQKTNIRILQEPRIFTADNQEASFFEGQDVPILQSNQTTAEGTVNEQVTYQQVGVGLNVRPRITEEGEVDLELNLVISNIVPGAEQFNSPIFDRRETTTQVIVKNGQTIVLSGIMKELESKVTRGLPLLGDIPIIGELFKSHETTTSRKEIIAFITPIIVIAPSDNDNNFNRQDLERLNNLMLPLDDQKRNMRMHSDDLRSRLLNKHYVDDDSKPEAEAGNPDNNDG